VDAPRLVRELEARYPAAPALMAHVTDDATGERLAPGMAEAGFAVGRELVMAEREPPDRPPPAGVARLASEAEVAAVEALQLREDGLSAADAAAVAAGRGRMRAAAPATVRVVAGREGRDAATAVVYHDGATGMIEDVGTLAGARGRGLARAAIGLAIAETRGAGCDLVALFADQDDWPLRLYERLGFRRIGRIWTFLRPAPR
jgi:ribosomal protein S18 acetylase RimI-like enzyme